MIYRRPWLVLATILFCFATTSAHANSCTVMKRLQDAINGPDLIPKERTSLAQKLFISKHDVSKRDFSETEKNALVKILVQLQMGVIEHVTLARPGETFDIRQHTYDIATVTEIIRNYSHHGEFKINHDIIFDLVLNEMARPSQRAFDNLTTIKSVAGLRKVCENDLGWQFIERGNLIELSGAMGQHIAVHKSEMTTRSKNFSDLRQQLVTALRANSAFYSKKSLPLVIQSAASFSHITLALVSRGWKTSLTQIPGKSGWKSAVEEGKQADFLYEDHVSYFSPTGKVIEIVANKQLDVPQLEIREAIADAVMNDVSYIARNAAGHRRAAQKAPELITAADLGPIGSVKALQESLSRIATLGEFGMDAVGEKNVDLSIVYGLNGSKITLYAQSSNKPSQSRVDYIVNESVRALNEGRDFTMGNAKDLVDSAKNSRYQADYFRAKQGIEEARGFVGIGIHLRSEGWTQSSEHRSHQGKSYTVVTSRHFDQGTIVYVSSIDGTALQPTAQLKRQLTASVALKGHFVSAQAIDVLAGE